MSNVLQRKIAVNFSGGDRKIRESQNSAVRGGGRSGIFPSSCTLGVYGYLPKDTSSAHMIAAVRSVMQGKAVYPPKLFKSLFDYVSRGLLQHTGKPEQAGHSVSDLTCGQRQLMADEQRDCCEFAVV
jgi:hypothetical protein